MNNLKHKTLRYQIGYWFFLILAIVGLSVQMYKYIIDELTLNYQELILTSVLSLFVIRPMVIADLISLIVKRKYNAN